MNIHTNILIKINLILWLFKMHVSVESIQDFSLQNVLHKSISVIGITVLLLLLDKFSLFADLL